MVNYIVVQFLKPHLNKVFLFQVAFSANQDILLRDSTIPESVVLNFLCINFLFVWAILLLLSDNATDFFVDGEGGG